MKKKKFAKIAIIAVLLCIFCFMNACKDKSKKVEKKADEVIAKAETPADDCTPEVYVEKLKTTMCGSLVPVSIDHKPQPVEKHVRAFTKVPYAEPPIGDLRWVKPQPIQTWPEKFDATGACPMCPQQLEKQDGTKYFDGDEDCLYLNIWTPETIEKPLPVMFFIHGGAFSQGTGGGPLYDGAYMSGKENVVVVTINYRLNVFGFLVNDSTEPGENLPGNFGLMDQELALNWVHDYIAPFGGDPGNITIFGESAGAMSIGFHLMRKKEDQVFKAAIMESNPYGIPYLTAKQAQSLTQQLKINLNKPTIAKMREIKDWQTIWKKANSTIFDNIPLNAIDEWGLMGFMCWKPVIGDSHYNFTQPIRAITNKPLIIGTNRDEGLMFADILKNILNPHLEKYGYKKGDPLSAYHYKTVICMLFCEKKDGILAQPQYQPLDDGDNTFKFGQVLTDCCFTAANQSYIAANTANPLYVYYYPHVSTFCFPSLYPDCCNKVCHAAELPYVFHTFKNKGLTATDKEKTFSDQIINYWTNFAEQKVPGGIWENYNSPNEIANKVLELNLEQKNITLPPCNYSFWKPIIMDLDKLTGCKGLGCFLSSDETKK